MSDPVLSHPPDNQSSRLDPPHDVMSTADEASTPWMALAGHDRAAVPGQLDRQSNELLAFVRQQDGELDTRQAELNAKLALLDNELRTQRLRTSLESGRELEVNSVQPDVPSGQTEDGDAKPPAGQSAKMPMPAANETICRAKPVLQEFEEVEHIVAGMADREGNEDSLPQADPYPQGADATDADVQTSPVGDQTARGAAPSLKQGLRETDSGVDLDSMANLVGVNELDSSRLELVDQRLELDRRRAALEDLHQETQMLHRRALEMRLSTEQLLVEVSGRIPTEQVNHRLESLKNQLRQQFSQQLAAIDAKHADLAKSKQLIEQRQSDVQAQSSKLQQWVDSRHEEIRLLAARVEAREMLLDQRERRMREEFSNWEAQRRSYQDRLQGMLSRLELDDIE